MSTPAERTPGFAVFSSASGQLARERARRTTSLVPAASVIAADEHTHVVLWGDLRHRTLDAPIVLTRGARTSRADVGPDEARRIVTGELDLRDVLPPFAAIDWDAALGRLVLVVDWLGMRHLYLSEGDGIVGASSSSAVLAGLSTDRRIDREAIGVQSLLGWQLGAGTPFAGVQKMGPGSRVTLSRGVLTSCEDPPAPVRDAPSAADAARTAANVLSDFVSVQLDGHPDTVLQLTGGLDSRLLLAAIPRNRRSSVEAMTLAVPGSSDVEIASRLVVDQGMKHRTVELRGLQALTDEDAWSLCAAAARDLDCSADPVAFASIRWADPAQSQQPRLAGLGGEVARGFYYFGPLAPVGVSRTLASVLAQWRLFPNERVSPDALEPAFAAAATEIAVDRVHDALTSASDTWWTATDEFYLWQRMQRWAGTLASATCFDRPVINPMLDDRFVRIARALPPADKKNMRFLSRILLELDPDLANIPLDNRPSPRTYAEPSAANRCRLAALQARKVVGKAQQRWSHVTHPPPGGELLAGKVVRHWRTDPQILDPLRHLGIFRQSWLEGVVTGGQPADPSAVALLVNLVVACGTVPALTAGSGSRFP
ncbi:asparagine synthase-related protein [Aeromicrobium yanjiei]|uniref:asparagine synthase (glutamine-hydrolyzing) n=1 Tax=Aeromicrobium yanjiei TaxID=2662028 RepID=A0A5Q2MKP6_9ACTN|nr:asparagine synthase-related protein [Aeromicrobium yanjiei]QGG42351.1 hypothetical protein GEV26_13745 [Aeromicrobium yanjiei]